MNGVKLLVLLAVFLMATSFASAQNLEIDYVRINGEQFDVTTNIGTHSENLVVERGEEINIRVRVRALADVNNVQVEADIVGYRYSHKRDEADLVSDTSKIFDLGTGDVDTIDLDLEIPIRIDTKFTLLRIRVADEDGVSFQNDYQLRIMGIDEADAVIVKDFSISPSSAVNAGRAFTGMVRVENIGDDDLDDVKVTMSIPDLNIRDSEYLDELDADEKETLEAFLLRIPDCAEPGVYDLDIDVEFDEFESTTETTQITVLAGDTCVANAPSSRTGRVVINVPDTQDVSAGTETAYPVIISNEGASAQTFTITVSGVSSWGSSRLSPSSVVVVPAGATETVFLYVKPDGDADGEQVFVATVTSSDDTKSIPLTANVVGGGSQAPSLKRGLEVALVVLVIILIIVGLIIGFNKLRGQEDDGAQTYY